MGEVSLREEDCVTDHSPNREDDPRRLCPGEYHREQQSEAADPYRSPEIAALLCEGKELRRPHMHNPRDVLGRSKAREDIPSTKVANRGGPGLLPLRRNEERGIRHVLAEPLLGLTRSEDHHPPLIDDCADRVGGNRTASQLALETLYGHEPADTQLECSVLIRDGDCLRSFLSVERRRPLNDKVEESVPRID